ncbi:hypothetical protein HK104_010886 [Borealophlyctis nickersoniae]|nr:hypothetical protein HK104_010886 [Borealophlyctis nickersoniae]
MAVDVGAMMMACPRKVHFWTKNELFRGPPILKSFMRAMGCVPVDRKGKSKENNVVLFTATVETIEKGGAIVVFLEGTSHDETHLLEAKQGAAWAILQHASETADSEHLAPIVPIGITYEPSKEIWRSSVIIRYGPPVEIGPYLKEYVQDQRAAVKRLTEDVRKALSKVIIEAPDKKTLEWARKARQIITGHAKAPKDITVIQSVVKALERTDDVQVASARRAVDAYHTSLSRARLKDQDVELFGSKGSRMSFVTLLIRWILQTVAVCLASIAWLPGFIVHAPLHLLAHIIATFEKLPESKAQITIFSSQITVPLFYTIYYYLIRSLFPFMGKSWWGTLAIWFGLVEFGLLYIRLVDHKAKVVGRWAGTGRLVMATGLGKDLAGLVKERESVKKVLERVVLSGEAGKVGADN